VTRPRGSHGTGCKLGGGVSAAAESFQAVVGGRGRFVTYCWIRFGGKEARPAGYPSGLGGELSFGSNFDTKTALNSLVRVRILNWGRRI